MEKGDSFGYNGLLLNSSDRFISSLLVNVHIGIFQITIFRKVGGNFKNFKTRQSSS